ncbi:MAG: hypothetical protein KKI09_10440 [Spirochaetes bacterium]|nr:hypothetical protein [Spirochaetota bacterium]MBU0955835.1 hypothetical protein [Spirochaetota bacterium]
MNQKNLIMYLSRSGHARAVAKDLGDLLDSPVREIGDKVNRRGFWGFMKSGFQARAGLATPIDDPVSSLEGVDHLVLVQPVWASRVAPPLRSWLRAHAAELAGVKTHLFLVYMGSDPEQVRQAFTAEFGATASLGHALDKSSPEERKAAIAAFAATVS